MKKFLLIYPKLTKQFLKKKQIFFKEKFDKIHSNWSQVII